MCDSLAGQNYTNEELEDCRFEEFVKFISQTNQVTIIIWPIIALIGILANACGKIFFFSKLTNYLVNTQHDATSSFHIKFYNTSTT